MAAEYIVGVSGWIGMKKLVRRMSGIFKRIDRLETTTKKVDKVLSEQGKSLHDHEARIGKLEDALHQKSSEAHGLRSLLGKEKKKAQRAAVTRPH